MYVILLQYYSLRPARTVFLKQGANLFCCHPKCSNICTLFLKIFWTERVIISIAISQKWAIDSKSVDALADRLRVQWHTWRQQRIAAVAALWFLPNFTHTVAICDWQWVRLLWSSRCYCCLNVCDTINHLQSFAAIERTTLITRSSYFGESDNFLLHLQCFLSTRQRASGFCCAVPTGTNAYG